MIYSNTKLASLMPNVNVVECHFVEGNHYDYLISNTFSVSVGELVSVRTPEGTVERVKVYAIRPSAHHDFKHKLYTLKFISSTETASCNPVHRELIIKALRGK